MVSTAKIIERLGLRVGWIRQRVVWNVRRYVQRAEVDLHCLQVNAMGRKRTETGQRDLSRGRFAGDRPEEKLDEPGECFRQSGERVVRQSGPASGRRVARGRDGKPRQGSELEEGSEKVRGEIARLEGTEGESAHGLMKPLVDKEPEDGHDFFRLRDGR